MYDTGTIGRDEGGGVFQFCEIECGVPFFSNEVRSPNPEDLKSVSRKIGIFVILAFGLSQ